MANPRYYSDEELIGIYELGRLYLDTGYFAPAERIFSGLSVVDGGKTPAKCGLGVVKLERGLFQQSQVHFRQAIQDGRWVIQAKLGLVVSFIATEERERAKSLLVELGAEIEKSASLGSELRTLWEALALRCDER